MQAPVRSNGAPGDGSEVPGDESVARSLSE